MHANPAVLDRHLRHLRHEAAERLVNRDTAEGPLGERLSPTGLLRGQVEDAQVAPMLLEQPAPILQRVEPHGTCQLVHEALNDEAGMRMADRTPPEDRDARLGGMQADPVVRDRLQVGGIGGAFDGRSVHALLDHHLRERGPLEDGLADDRLTPGDRQTIAAEARVQPVHPHRPVVAAAHVVLTSPHHFDRHPGRLGDMSGLDDEVVRGRGTPAETAAEKRGVDLDLLGLQAEDASRGGLIPRLKLRPCPDLAAISSGLDRAVQRLHRGVREVRQLVFRFDLRLGPAHRRLDVPGGRGLQAWRSAQGAELFSHLLAIQLRARPEIPLDLERVTADLGGPEMLGHHGDP